MASLPLYAAGARLGPSTCITCLRASNHSTTRVGSDLSILLKHLLGSTNREFFGVLQAAGISFSQLKCLALLSNADAPLSLGACPMCSASPSPRSAARWRASCSAVS